MKFLFTILTVATAYTSIWSQSYTSYFTGDTTDVSPVPESGVCLMGGATENDNAMRWFLQKANGGDVVVIRVTGSDGYNDYMYSQLNVTINSVETIIIPSVAAANNPYVRRQLRNAEAIWIAGGDQANYVNFWKNTAVDSALNDLINIKKGVVGGTSAGMAIMGQAYFAALNGTVTSTAALNNPYGSLVSIGYNDFILNPKLAGVITDTHFDSPDRRGRMVTLLARLVTDYNQWFMGIACDEYSAVCIGNDLKARVFGDYPTNDDNVYFIQPDTCSLPFSPETCASGSPLTWKRDKKALRVYRIKAENTGAKYFDLNTKNGGEGGEWQHWYAENGIFLTGSGAGVPPCNTNATVETADEKQITLYPNPAGSQLTIESPGESPLSIIAENGAVVLRQTLHEGHNAINIRKLTAGIYFVETRFGKLRFTKQ